MSNSHSQYDCEGFQFKESVFLVPIFVLLLIALYSFFTAPKEVSAGMYFGEYNSRFEQDSIRNQEEIIRLLREQNRILERSR